MDGAAPQKPLWQRCRRYEWRATVIFSLASLGCSVAALRYGSAGLALVGLGLGLLACLALYTLERP